MFYNPAMAFDRDLGVAFVTAVAPARDGSSTGWEMTSATGVRGLRLLHETHAFSSFRFSESHPEALAVLRANAERFPGASVVAGDSRPAPSGARFDYVDLDPYGSPIPFVEAAIGAVRDGGVLAVTATDMMVLAGAQPAACLRRYGARPVRGRLGPEGGLRILLAYLSKVAEQHARSVRPLLCYSRDHYVRTCVEVGPERADPAPVAAVDPGAWTGPWLGDRGPYGPLWLGPLFDADLVTRLRVPEGAARPVELERFLTVLREEIRVDRPFYFEANVLASQLQLPAPPSLKSITEGLSVLGFRAARTHARPEGFRTDAARDVVEQLVARLGGISVA